jgi:predicted lipopolysaccharide heptosyltransferase III
MPNLPAVPIPRTGVFATGAVRGAPERLRTILESAPRLLLIRLRSLGDSILTLPLLTALHRWRPDLLTDILIEDPFAAVFSGHPDVHEVLVLKVRNAPAATGWTRAQTVLQIRRRHYPVVLNLHGGTTSLIFSLLSGAGVRIGQETYRRSGAYHIRIPPSSAVWGRTKVHTAEHQLTLLRWLSLPGVEAGRAKISLNEEARRAAGKRLSQAGIAPGAYILIHPTATLFTKQWPEENFARLADALSQRCRLPVIFTSAPHEATTLLNIDRIAAGRHSYWSDLNLEALFALIESARLFIGNDSGPTHAAAAFGRPVVVVWGSSDFDAWHPWKTEFEVVRSDFPCMPCPGYSCAAFGMPRCVLDIPVERVIDACGRLLERTSADT